MADRLEYPLHNAVWLNDLASLRELLTDKQCDIEKVDPRGRTPLHLATTMSRGECVRELLKHGADVMACNRHHWPVLHEAVCSGNREVIGMVMERRDQCMEQFRNRDVPLLLERLESSSDFYIEMKWEFSSWVPFVTRLCPNDTYRIWKKGATVRVDTTLVGFEKMNWIRGNQTFIFQGQAESATVIEIDHEKKTVWREEIKLKSQEMSTVENMAVTDMSVASRLSSPVVNTVIDTQKISFARQKSGIWGFRSDRSEQVNGYDTKVFSVAGLEMVTRTRIEHLPENLKKQATSNFTTPLHTLFGAAQNRVADVQPLQSLESVTQTVSDEAPRLTISEYLTPPTNPEDYDTLGRPVEEKKNVQKLKASIWLSEDFPLKLEEQILPIVDLLAISNTHFAKLRDFITLQLPSGFPIKFEIPLFHVISAKVTFSNLNGCGSPVPHVEMAPDARGPSRTDHKSQDMNGKIGETHFLSQTEQEGLKRRHPATSVAHLATKGGLSEVWEPSSRPCAQCLISDSCFEIPPSYERLNRVGSGLVGYNEEELLQMAIEQSLLDQEKQPSETSPSKLTLPEPVTSTNLEPSFQDDLQIAVALSLHTVLEDDSFRKREEEELEMVLKLSLQEK